MGLAGAAWGEPRSAEAEREGAPACLVRVPRSRRAYYETMLEPGGTDPHLRTLDEPAQFVLHREGDPDSLVRLDALGDVAHLDDPDAVCRPCCDRGGRRLCERSDA